MTKCAICQPPDSAPGLTSESRLHGGHVGVRFGDDGGRYRVTYYDEDVTDDTIEADAEAGWVLVMTTDDAGRRTLCSAPLADHALAEVRRGRVDIEMLEGSRRG